MSSSISAFGSSNNDDVTDVPDPIPPLHGGSKVRAKIEGCFGGCGRLFAGKPIAPAIAIVFLVFSTALCSAGLKNYYVEGSTAVLWTEIGGRLEVRVGCVAGTGGSAAWDYLGPFFF